MISKHQKMIIIMVVLFVSTIVFLFVHDKALEKNRETKEPEELKLSSEYVGDYQLIASAGSYADVYVRLTEDTLAVRVIAYLDLNSKKVWKDTGFKTNYYNIKIKSDNSFDVLDADHYDSKWGECYVTPKYLSCTEVGKSEPGIYKRIETMDY